VSSIDTGLSRQEAERRAPELLRRLRESENTLVEDKLDVSTIDVLHAACDFISLTGEASGERLVDAENLYRYLETIAWPGPDFGGLAELRAHCALAGWRMARKIAFPPIAEKWSARVVGNVMESPILKDRFDRARASLKIEGRSENHALLDDPYVLLPLQEALRHRWEMDPPKVQEEAVSLYRLLEEFEQRETPSFLLDERQYFLGETARIIGNVFRAFSKKEDANRWLDIADEQFTRTVDAAGNLSRVAYHRLALRIEERQFDAVSSLLPQLTSRFKKLRMIEEALKCQFLEACILKETDRLQEAFGRFSDIAHRAQNAKMESVLAHAYINLAQICALRGEAEQAVEFVRIATPLLNRLGNRSALGKLQLAMGLLFRTKGNLPRSIEAYRAAQATFAEVDMRADIAAVQLQIADLLIDAGQDKQAEWEIRQALPIIDEYKLVPEGFAALSLLRESLRRQKIDRQALRKLHGYFEKLSS
jgi:hypothetical protein